MKRNFAFLILGSHLLMFPNFTYAMEGPRDNTKNIWEESHDGVIVSHLQNLGYLKGDILKKKAIKPKNGSSAHRILFIKTLEKKWAIKETTRADRYGIEEDLIKSKKVPEFKAIIKDYAEKHHLKLPLLTDYHIITPMNLEGKEVYLTLMERAKGEDLSDINDKIFRTYELKKIPFTETQMIEMGREIGEQMGNLARAFFEKNKTILIHGDMQAANFLYDAKRKQLSWVDLGNTKENFWPSSSPFDSYFVGESTLIRTLWQTFFPCPLDFTEVFYTDAKSFTSLVKRVKEEGLDTLKAHRLGIIAGESFLKAYIEKVEDLEPAKEWKTTRISFKTDLDKAKDHYKEAVKKAFDEDSERVLAHLFL